MTVHEISDFETDVLKKSHEIPVVVDFWAEWCGPCRVLGPVLEKLEEKSNGAWKLAKVDTDRHQDLALEYGIRGIPAVKLFVDGKVVNEFTGALPETMVKQWLGASLPNKFRKDLATAAQLLAIGRTGEAIPLLEEVLREDAANEEARVLLASRIYMTNPLRAEELIAGIDESSRHFQLAEAVRTMLRLGHLLSHPEELPEHKVKPNYLEAVREHRVGDTDGALNKFIEVIREDRPYDNDGARKACIAIFRLLGDEHETTLKYRREFSSALNS